MPSLYGRSLMLWGVGIGFRRRLSPFPSREHGGVGVAALPPRNHDAVRVKVPALCVLSTPKGV
jgi:hypothetical protein